MSHAYSRDDAECVLDAFPEEKLNELCALAANIERNPILARTHSAISLPEGWAYAAFSNCIVAAYQDGDQERKEFFVPQIVIQFLYVSKMTITKTVFRRFALGYCSCGKPMPLARTLLWAADMIGRKDFWSLPSKAIGYVVGFTLGLWLKMSSVQQYSLLFNRHPDCL